MGRAHLPAHRSSSPAIRRVGDLLFRLKAEAGFLGMDSCGFRLQASYVRLRADGGRNVSPRSSALRAPMPRIPCSSLDRLRPEPRHLAQRRVVEDDVRRHAARARDLQAHGAQPLEQIAIDVLPRLRLRSAIASHALLHRPPLPREHEIGLRSPDPSCSATPRSRQRHHRKRIVGLPQQAVRDQLLDVAAHFGDRRVAQQAERAELMMARATGPARCRCRTGRWRRAPRRTAARRARRTTGSCARATTGSAAVSSSSRQIVAGAAVVPADTCRRSSSTRCRWRQPTLAA